MVGLVTSVSSGIGMNMGMNLRGFVRRQEPGDWWASAGVGLTKQQSEG